MLRIAYYVLRITQYTTYGVILRQELFLKAEHDGLKNNDDTLIPFTRYKKNAARANAPAA